MQTLICILATLVQRPRSTTATMRTAPLPGRIPMVAILCIIGALPQPPLPRPSKKPSVCSTNAHRDHQNKPARLLPLASHELLCEAFWKPPEKASALVKVRTKAEAFQSCEQASAFFPAYNLPRGLQQTGRARPSTSWFQSARKSGPAPRKLMAAAIPSFSGASRASARAGSTQRDDHGNATMIREGPFFSLFFLSQNIQTFFMMTRKWMLLGWAEFFG